MIWDLSKLKAEAPLGFSLLEGVVCYEGPKPTQFLPNMVLVQSIEEAVNIGKKYLTYGASRNMPENSHFLTTWRGNSTWSNYFFYRINEPRFEKTYTILRKIYDNWYERETITDFDSILHDNSKEFNIDGQDFESFSNALKDSALLYAARKNNERTAGELMALAYSDYLRISFENKRPAKRSNTDTGPLQFRINKYKELDEIELSPEHKKNEKGK